MLSWNIPIKSLDTQALVLTDNFEVEKCTSVFKTKQPSTLCVYFALGVSWLIDIYQAKSSIIGGFKK